MTLIIALMIWLNPIPDDLRFAIADHYQTQTQAAVELLRDQNCTVYEDLTATCEGAR